jgi:hypothetical protein
MHAFISAETVTTISLQTWIKDNLIPLLILVAALTLFALARKGNNAKAIQVVGGVVIALAVLGLAVGGNAEAIGSGIWNTVTGA